MYISGMSGNEIFCLAEKGYEPGEIAVGNSVVSMGVGGAVGAFGKSVAGGEIRQITQLISDGRHAAISRMESEAQKAGAQGITGVDTSLGSLAGFTEFFAQGTGVHGPSHIPFFSSAASGIEMYCHLDAGYVPMRFAMGNIAYALGVGRGVAGTLRTLARGEVHEFSSMYNEIRQTALRRLREEAAACGANAVVDVQVRMLPYGVGTVELLLTGTASHHPGLSEGRVTESQVVTSELSGEELWNLARLGLVPHQLVMATSVFSLGVAGSIGALFQSIQRRELPEVTKLIYEARENCLDLVRKEAIAIGADRVIGNRLQIREIGSGMVEVVALGTAMKRRPDMPPASPLLIPQAVIVDKGSRKVNESIQTLTPVVSPMNRARKMGGVASSQLIGCIASIILFAVLLACSLLAALMQQ